MKKSSSNLQVFVFFVSMICFLFVAISFAQQIHHFKPTKFYYTYDAKHEPVLKLKPGDTLITTTVDAFGNKISRQDQRASELVHLPEVNHQTGPFYVEGAEPGDTLVLQLLNVRPNRDYAVSTHLPHFGVLTGETYTAMLTEPLPERTYVWKLDLTRNLATLDLPESKLGKAEIPLHPFLGTVGVAPAFGEAVLSLTPAEHGGNMDCVETKTGTTLYFPVFVKGALFMLGDGHAAQGDGEICGTGLECSLDVTVKVDVIKGKEIYWPRFEDDEYIMVAASTRPLIDAFRVAHVELINWMVSDYGFDRWDALQLVSQAGITRVGNVVDPKYTVVAKFPKKYLQAKEEPIGLWPPIEPYETGYLKVSEIHEIYYELCGNPEGKPVFVLHGGPGASISPYYRQFFNPKTYRIVLYDQRGCGKYHPSFELRENTSQHLVEDIERLRNHLKLGKIILFGGSWGSTLALAYGETYPGNVSGMVLRGIFTAAKDEIDHFYRGGVRPFFPEIYEKLKQVLGQEPSPQAIFKMVQSDDPDERQKSSIAWTVYEFKLGALNTPDAYIKQFVDAKDNADLIVSLALVENYYMANGCFFEEGQLLRDASKIKDIPIVMVNGRYDMICPPINAYRLHKRLSNSKLIIVEAAGHWMGDPPVQRALLKTMREFE